MATTGNRGRTRRTGRGGRPLRRGGATVLLAAALVLAATACSSGGDGGSGGGKGADRGVAALPGKASASAARQGAATVEDAVAFATCMRENGVPGFKDPEPGKPFADGVDTGSPEFKKAQAACKSYAPPAPAAPDGGADVWSPADKLEYAACMRENGVPDFADPDSGGGFMLPPGVDPNTPQFKQADQACAAHKPDALRNPTVNQPVGG
ncbi:hypothetical protein ACFV6F_34365 [Kitasatospora phosalacinea]|uniref:hypothetical protein n=1 Tax=Kitasatospora phosalacinea TaxID=2065 RepID=UPI00365D7CEF